MKKGGAVIMNEIKIIEKELNQSFSDCVNSHWKPSVEGYYVGQKQILKLLGYNVTISNGKHKLYKQGDKNVRPKTNP